jgi:hypothetical protein
MVNNTNRKTQCLLAMNFVKHNDKTHKLDKTTFSNANLKRQLLVDKTTRKIFKKKVTFKSFDRT